MWSVYEERTDLWPGTVQISKLMVPHMHTGDMKFYFSHNYSSYTYYIFYIKNIFTIIITFYILNYILYILCEVRIYGKSVEDSQTSLKMTWENMEGLLACLLLWSGLGSGWRFFCICDRVYAVWISQWHKGRELACIIHLTKMCNRKRSRNGGAGKLSTIKKKTDSGSITAHPNVWLK